TDHLALTVGAPAAGGATGHARRAAAAARACRRRQDPRHRVGQTAQPLLPIGLAHSRAVEAGIPEAGAVGAGPEPATDTRGVETELGVDVGDALARPGHRRHSVVVVHAVAPLVVEDGGDLPGVGTAAALAVEIDRRAVPEGIAG